MSLNSNTEKDELDLSINNSNNIIFDINKKTKVGRPSLNLSKEDKNLKSNKWNREHKIENLELNKTHSKRLTNSMKILTYLVRRNLIVKNEYNIDIENFINNKILSENLINLKN